MTHSLSSLTPFSLAHASVWGGLIVLPLACSAVSPGFSQAPQLPVGGQLQTMASLEALPDGYYQFCSEPEPSDFRLGAGRCYWFNKIGDQVIGYYGRPHSSDFIDCVKGRIENEKIIGKALSVSWEGEPGLMLKDQSFTWDDITLASGHLEYQTQGRAGQVQVVEFDQVSLSLTKFYRYSQAKVDQMKPPPVTCNAKAWVVQLTGESSHPK